MIRPWKFRCYRDSSGIDVIRVWYDQLPEEAQTLVSGQLHYEQWRPIERWKELGEYKQLTGNLADLEELIFVLKHRVMGKQVTRAHYRVLGFSELDRMEFTMLVGFEKTTSIGLDYARHGPVALGRKSAVLVNRNFSISADWLFP